MGKLLHRYILREIVTPFGLGLLVFTFVLLIARLVKLIELVVNRGLPTTDILRLLGYIVPAFLEFTVPTAMLLSILVAFGRLSADSEIVAIRSSGLSLYQLVPPVATFALVVALATSWLTFVASPWGNRSLKTALFDIARTHASAGLQPRVFNDEFPGIVIYAERIDATTDRLHHVLISDARDPNETNTVFAREGIMIPDPTGMTLTLRLLHGASQGVEEDGKVAYRTEFDSYDVSLDLQEALAGVQQQEREPKEFDFPTLRQMIDDPATPDALQLRSRVEYQRRLAIPSGCFILALIAMPLGIQPTRAVRSWGFVMSLVVIFAYFILLSTGQGLAEEGLVPPVVGLWLANAVLGLLGVYLFLQAAREQPNPVLEWGRRLATELRGRVEAHLGSRL
jgi:lipopolysaccharide export system permease protein